MPGYLRASVFFVLATALILGLIVDQALSNINTGHVEALWKDYVVAEKRLRFDVAHLVGHKWPELHGIADLQRDQQWALIELRNMKFRYLMEFEPDRIVYDEGLTQFADFEWTDEDSEALREVNPEFSKLERWAEQNSKRLAEHPDLVMAGENLTTLQRDESYQKMIERYQARMDDLESALDTILRAQKRAERTKALQSQIGR